MSPWKITRIGLILICGISALLNTQPERATGIDWTGVLVCFLAFPLIAAVGAAIRLTFPKTRFRISKPDWNRSFLDFSRPEQFFYVGAILTLVSGIVAAVRSIATFGFLPPVSAAPIAISLGLLLALHALAFLSETGA
jgi:hypothetical protein